MQTPESLTTDEPKGNWRLVGMLVGVLLLVVVLPRTWLAGGEGAEANRELAGELATVHLGMSVDGQITHQLEVPVREGMTLLEVMTDLAQREPAWKFVAQGSGAGAIITTLGGRGNEHETGSYWTYEVNGEMAQVGIGSYRVRAGDDILWKLAPRE